MLTRSSNRLSTAGRLASLVLRRPYIMLMILLLLVLGGVVLFRRPEDWHKVYVLGGRWLLEGRDFYHVQTTGFTYPPAAALLALPFALVPPLVARAGYILLSAAGLITFWWTSWWTAGGQRDPGWPVHWRGIAKTGDSPGRRSQSSAESAVTGWREHAVLALGMLVGFRFVTDVLEHQQTDILIAALVAGAGYLVLRGCWLAAAVCCGLGAGLKATPLIWVLYFLVCQRWQAALVLVAVAVGINLLPDSVSHPPHARLWLQRWIEQVLAPLASGQQIGQWYTTPVLNQSLAGTLYRLLVLAWPRAQADYFGAHPQVRALNGAIVQGVIRAARGVLLLLGLGAIVWTRWRRSNGSTAEPGERGARPAQQLPGRRAAWSPGSQAPGGVPRMGLECSIMLMLMVLLSPASSKPHFLVVLLPAYCLLRMALYGQDRLAGTCLAVALLFSLLSNRSLVGKVIGEPAQWAGGITWCALVLLVGCGSALLRPARSAHDPPRSDLAQPSVRSPRPRRAGS